MPACTNRPYEKSRHCKLHHSFINSKSKQILMESRQKLADLRQFRGYLKEQALVQDEYYILVDDLVAALGKFDVELVPDQV